jgi:hypothetical protein
MMIVCPVIRANPIFGNHWAELGDYRAELGDYRRRPEIPAEAP